MKNGHFKLMIILAAICGLMACKHADTQTGLPYFNTPDFTPQWLDKDSYAYQTLHKIPNFSFTDQNGQTVSSATVKHKICVVDFFFTRCGSICPRMTDNLNAVAQAFANDAGVLILSHSVTPELDNPAVLKRYALQKNITSPQWHLLTGNRTAIYNIARKGYFADELLGFNKDTTQFLHTENFVLVDGNGHIRGVYNGTIPFEVQNLIGHIKKLKLEKS